MLTGCGSVHASAADSVAVDDQTKAVVADYESYWTAVLAASDPVAVHDSTLARYAAGAELERMQRVLGERQRMGEVVRGSYRHVETAVTPTGSSATLHDCLAPRLQVVDARSGKVKQSTPGTPTAVDVVMVKSSQGWQVQDITPAARSCQGPAAQVTATSGGPS
jgi:hypothetical protein